MAAKYQWRSYHEILEDCAFNPDIMSEETLLVRKVKYIIDRKIAIDSKTLILLYTEYNSLRKLSQKLDVSHVTVKNRIAAIRREIFIELEKLKDIDI